MSSYTSTNRSAWTQVLNSFSIWNVRWRVVFGVWCAKC